MGKEDFPLDSRASAYPNELFEGAPDMRTAAGRQEKLSRIAKYVLLREVERYIPFSEEQRIKIAAGEVEDTFWRSFGKVWSSKYDNGQAKHLADLETTANNLGIYDFIDWPEHLPSLT